VFYASFGNVDGTSVDVAFTNKASSPWCTNPAKATDGDFQTGVAPPSLHSLENEWQWPVHTPKRLVSYRTSGNQTIWSFGELKIGDEVFFAKTSEFGDCCCDADDPDQLDELDVPWEELGWLETIVD
jgi:hypothetical protein